VEYCDDGMKGWGRVWDGVSILRKRVMKSYAIDYGKHVHIQC